MPYPNALADRLIRMFSFAGDTVLDPFGGTGTTSVAAISNGRNSISIEIEPSYVAIASENISKAAQKVGAAFEGNKIGIQTARKV